MVFCFIRLDECSYDLEAVGFGSARLRIKKPFYFFEGGLVASVFIGLISMSSFLLKFSPRLSCRIPDECR